MESKRLFIAGCGYVGTAVAKLFKANDWQIVTLTRNFERAEYLRGMGIEVIVDDLDNTSWHAQAEGDFDLVLNTVSAASRGPEGYIKSYINGQKSLIEWCTQRKVSTYIYTSATSVYPQSDESWVGEEDVPEVLSTNGKLLRESEMLVEKSRGHFNQWVVLRLAGIYGPGRHLLFDQVKSGNPQLAGRGDTYLNLIHRDDIVRAIELISMSRMPECSGIYNLSDSNPTRKQAIVDWTAAYLNVATPQYNPNEENPRGKNRQVNGQLPNRKISSEKFRTKFNWEPKYPSFREGFSDFKS